MKRFVITATGTAIEQYIVLAVSEEEARRMFFGGEITKPLVSEVHDSVIDDVTEIPMLEEVKA